MKKEKNSVDQPIPGCKRAGSCLKVLDESSPCLSFPSLDVGVTRAQCRYVSWFKLMFLGPSSPREGEAGLPHHR